MLILNEGVFCVQDYLKFNAYKKNPLIRNRNVACCNVMLLDKAV